MLSTLGSRDPGLRWLRKEQGRLWADDLRGQAALLATLPFAGHSLGESSPRLSQAPFCRSWFLLWWEVQGPDLAFKKGVHERPWKMPGAHSWPQPSQVSAMKVVVTPRSPQLWAKLG